MLGHLYRVLENISIDQWKNVLTFVIAATGTTESTHVASLFSLVLYSSFTLFWQSLCCGGHCQSGLYRPEILHLY
jgi:hypothetical protein